MTVPCPCGIDDCSMGEYADDTRQAMDYIATHCREQWNPDDVTWFEYHCNESPDSEDAPAWYRSHQQVTVLRQGDNDGWEGSTFIQRSHACTPRTYIVRFADGLEWAVFEDELVNSPAAFERPDPPKESRQDWQDDPELTGQRVDFERSVYERADREDANDDLSAS